MKRNQGTLGCASHRNAGSPPHWLASIAALAVKLRMNPMPDTVMSRVYSRIALAALLALLAACASPLVDFDTPEVDLIGMRPIASSGMEARFAVQLRVINPNTTPLNVDGLHYRVFLRDQKALSGVSAEAVRIPAYGEGLVELEASAGMLGSLALLRDLMANPPDSGLPYRLEVKLSVGGALRALRVEREGVLRLTP